MTLCYSFLKLRVVLYTLGDLKMGKFSKFCSTPTPILDKIVIPILLMIYTVSACWTPLERNFQILMEMQSLGQIFFSIMRLVAVGAVFLVGISPMVRGICIIISKKIN